MKKMSQFRQYQEDAKVAALRSIDAAKPTMIHVPTGGGKTRIANDVVAERIGDLDGPVLWVTKDWQLLLQAFEDLEERHPRIAANAGRIGRDGTVLDHLPDRFADSVIYSTLQTLRRRIPRYWQGKLPGIVVWDECHWAENSTLGRRLLRWCSQNDIPVLGLTATPSLPDRSRFFPAYSITFKELLEQGCLAEPITFEPVKTGKHWEPKLMGKGGDFTGKSLRDLVDDSDRNELIVRNFFENAPRYGKTILFACSVEHADILAESFEKEAIAVSIVHSDRDKNANKRALQQFESGAVRLMINVCMLTHGVDIPDIETVMLTRPTTSDRLFTQMIGRASRTCEGKSSFNIVEFTDNLEKYADCLYTTKRFFEGAGFTSIAARRPMETFSVRRASHGFCDSGAPRWIPDSAGLPEAVRGLWYREGQTFGIEFELTAPDFVPNASYAGWHQKAEGLRRALTEALPAGTVAFKVSDEWQGGDADYSRWNVTWDGSCGWEVTSRILANQEGFEEVAKACDALTKSSLALGLEVNVRTGTHVHLGWKGHDVDEIKRLLLLAKLFEPALATQVAPSRIARSSSKGYRTGAANPYCRPIATVFGNGTIDGIDSMEDLFAACDSDRARYLTFNVKPIGDLHTVEVRMHSGTTEAAKILLWLSLWMQLLWSASKKRPVPRTEDRLIIVPDGDILALAAEHLPALEVQNPTFLRRLHERRKEVSKLWSNAKGLHRWRKYASRWDDRIIGRVLVEEAA